MNATLNIVLIVGVFAYGFITASLLKDGTFRYTNDGDRRDDWKIWLWPLVVVWALLWVIPLEKVVEVWKKIRPAPSGKAGEG